MVFLYGVLHINPIINLVFYYESIRKISRCFQKMFNTVASVHQYGTRQAGKGDIF